MRGNGLFRLPAGVETVSVPNTAYAHTGIRHQASGIRHQASGIRHQASGIRHQASGIRHQASGIRHQASGIRHQASGIRHQPARSPSSSTSPRTLPKRSPILGAEAPEMREAPAHRSRADRTHRCDVEQIMTHALQPHRAQIGHRAQAPVFAEACVQAAQADAGDLGRGPASARRRRGRGCIPRPPSHGAARAACRGRAGPPTSCAAVPSAGCRSPVARAGRRSGMLRGFG